MRVPPVLFVFFCVSSMWLLTAFGCGDERSGTGANPPPDGGDPPAGEALNVGVRLSGDYVSGLALEPSLPESAGGELGLRLAAEGLDGVRQFEMVVRLEPAAAFAPAEAVFEPATPFLTFGPGVEVLGPDRLRLGGASLQSAQSGTAVLGTLRLKTAASFSGSATVRVEFFSVGPSSSLRDAYEGDQLRMGVRLGP